jgi:hypothetical protein
LKTVDENFFIAFNRIVKIKDDCQHLNYKAVQQVLEYICRIENSAFDTLSIWCQRVIEEMAKETPKISKLMRKGVGVLKSRHSLFESLVGELVLIRRNVVRDLFLDLSVTTDDESQKCGELFAFIHQLAASEKETLTLLLNETEEGPQFLTEIIISMLDNILEGLCRPLRNRLDDILYRSPNSLTSLYKSANTIQFYTNMMQKMMPDVGDSGQKLHFLRYLEDITQISFSQFYEALGKFVKELFSDTSPVIDLQPPPKFFQTAEVLKQLLSIYERSLVLPLSPKEFDIFSMENASYTYPDVKESLFSPIIQALLEPLLRRCNIWASSLNDEADKALFLISCYQPLLNILILFSNIQDKCLELEGLISENMKIVEKKNESANNIINE